MARIILQWLNEEVCLSKEITSLSDDFSNGYLLGELLYKYNQQQSFDKFINSNSPDAKINNFCLLEPTMRNIGVYFNSNLVYDIINCKHGTMKTLLYEIKTILDGATKMIKLNDNKQINNVIKIIKPSVPNYDQTKSATFETAIRAMVENPKDILLEKATHKFTNMNETFHQSVTESHSQTLSTMKFQLERTKQMSRQKQQQEKEFQQTWDHLHVEQWKTNQKIAKNRKNLINSVNNELDKRKTKRINDMMTYSKNDSIEGIDDFEERYQEMDSKGLLNTYKSKNLNQEITLKSLSGLEDGTGIPEMTYLNQQQLQENIIKSHQEMVHQQTKLKLRGNEHDKRRKRYVRVKESSHSTLLQRDAEGEIYSYLLTTCHMEEVEKLQRMRVLVNKNVIIQNSFNRMKLNEKLTIERKEYEDKCNIRNTENELKLVIHNRFNSQEHKLKQFKLSKISAKDQEIIEIALNEIDRILDLTDWIVNLRLLGMYDNNSPGVKKLPLTYQDSINDNKDDIFLPNLIRNDIWKIYTCETLEIPESLPVPDTINVTTILPYSLSWKPLVPDTKWLMSDLFHGQDYLKDSKYKQILNLTDNNNDNNNNQNIYSNIILSSLMSKYLSTQERIFLSQYISKFEPIIEAEPVENHKKEKSSSSNKSDKKKDKKGVVEEEESGVKIIPPKWIMNTPNNCLLGETLVNVRSLSDPIPLPPTPPENIPLFPFRIILCGSSNAMKKTIAEAIKQEFSVTILRVDDLTSEAIERAEKLSISNSSGSSSRLLPSSSSSPSLSSSNEKVSNYDQLALKIYRDIIQGNVIDDQDYVELVIHAIHKLDPLSPGYVLEDFPNTLNQTHLLTYALSNINYLEHRPQIKDKISPYTTNLQYDNITWDYKQCGIDKVYGIVLSPEIIIQQRIQLRKDLRTGEIISLKNKNQSVETLSEIITPDQPVDTLSLQIESSQDTLNEMKDYLNELQIYKQINVIYEDDCDIIIHDIISDLLLVKQQKDEINNNNNNSNNSNGDVESNNNNNGNEINLSEGSQVLNDETSLNQGSSIISSKVQYIEGIALQPLAKALSSIWDTGEKQFIKSSEEYFHYLREIKYQMIQRRGMIKQITVLNCMIPDNRQEIYEEFQKEFNSYENDIRYDSDFINEFLLRILELRYTFYELIENKMKDIKDILNQISLENMIGVYVHSIQSEAASLIQSYCHLFVASLNILQDYIRSVSPVYNYNKEYAVVLEETAPAIDPTLPLETTNNSNTKEKGKSKEEKKVKNAVVGRSPLAPLLLSSETLLTLPEPIQDESLEDPKGKKKDTKPKGKKKSDENTGDLNPLSSCMNSALQFIETYSKSTFKIDRELYGGDEELSTLLEKAIWHEADRYRYLITYINNETNQTIEWLQSNETNIFEQCNEIINKQMYKELSIIERLIEMIKISIEQNKPIEYQWQLTYDNIVVRNDRRIFLKKKVELNYHENLFEITNFNAEQNSIFNKMLSKITLEKSSNIILKEDLINLFKLGNETLVGPFGKVEHINYYKQNNNDNNSNKNIEIFDSLVFPKLWRKYNKDFHNYLFDDLNNKLIGTNEITGVIAKDIIHEKLIKYGEEKYELLKKWTGGI